mmetsp:Transcript_57345/g.136307  ORF Transcript_57345/g.136307 Transcript_57345/m.136307 type:complete len:313 (-) Transcript_57345:168-1106(-)|eukprot:CAMPEP_0178458910 /NCGR_PEP_ID=MMETSP0689_2-20121128/47811_1 /TAXON_ID=160604 /ORGANISM="Amphidinium massartii, Strain CS-259" /LENGTH=312 /DNA_ID=CAMNT_0020085277 /DNA_START=96 /DNA_END=1034 /DNA_ORIENTATION=-
MFPIALGLLLAYKLAPAAAVLNFHPTEDDVSMGNSNATLAAGARRLTSYFSDTEMNGAWVNEIQLGTDGEEFIEVVIAGTVGGVDLVAEFEAGNLHLGLSARDPYKFETIGLEDYDTLTTLCNGAKVVTFSAGRLGFGKLQPVIAYFTRHNTAYTVYDCLHHGVDPPGGRGMASVCPRIHDEDKTISNTDGKTAQRNDFGGNVLATTVPGNWTDPVMDTKGDASVAQYNDRMYKNGICDAPTTTSAPLTSLTCQEKCEARGADFAPFHVFTEEPSNLRAALLEHPGCQQFSCCCYDNGLDPTYRKKECICAA